VANPVLSNVRFVTRALLLNLRRVFAPVLTVLLDGDFVEIANLFDLGTAASRLRMGRANQCYYR
jgi:hypothetical protein